ncbi:MAG: hypothetical protein ACJA1R_003187, partial [Flavobacteriales bacterium]
EIAPAAADAPAEPFVDPYCPEALPAAELLPGVEPHHRALDYWLSRVGAEVDLDDVLLDAPSIATHNVALALMETDLSRHDFEQPVPADTVRAEVDERIAYIDERFASESYVLVDGSAVPQAWRDAMAVPTNWLGTPTTYRLTADAQVRCAPLPDTYYTPSLDLRFDRNNCSTLRAGEPVQVLGSWENGMRLVRGGYTVGWLPASAPLSGPVDASTSRPGTSHPVLTRRSLLEQAFSHLDAPYGWGGESGGQDCSRFVMDVFEHFGVRLPRFSGHQALAGSFSLDVSDVTSETEKALLIDAAFRRGAVLLHFPGHIMLYLGRDDDGRAMAIHSFAEYLEPCDRAPVDPTRAPETLLEVDRVTVSDLELGRGTSRTAFIERLTRITVLGENPGIELQGAAEWRPPAPAPASETCESDESLFAVVTPRTPNARQPLAIVGTASDDLGPLHVRFEGPSGQVFGTEAERWGGPPYSYYAALPELPEEGSWRIVVGDGARFGSCRDVDVRARPPREGSGSGPVWDNRNRWSEDFENLYATFVERLFSYPLEADLTWTSLHELTRNEEHNILHNYYGQDEDSVLDLGPDCADLPYMLRAYFAWKTGLPFGYRSCTRGRAGSAPRCNNLQTNLQERAASGDVDAFQRFAGRSVRSGVHSASGRTHPDDDDTDYYPVALNRESLRPGTLYADPYGHLLIIAGWYNQGIADYGVLMGADAQPDGTVGRRRFWRGSFLFSPETTDVGAGFKAWRPVIASSDGEVTSLDNRALSRTDEFARYSLQQYEGDTDAFYGTMETMINPRPLDPVARMVSLVDSLDESVSRRTNSVNNGEAYMAGRSYSTVDMPTGYSIFETTGGWEDYSTPSRDMRLLISIDTVAHFPDVVRNAPERYGILVSEVDARVTELQEVLNAELQERAFSYTRSDGSDWPLTLLDVVQRASLFEVSYNPNDCPEIRWSASEGTDEFSTCDRRAPRAQQQRMLDYRAWFEERQRPPR